jgi:periplasmic protein CpxP/Spy
MKNAIRKTAVPLALSLSLLAGGAAAQSTAPASSTSSSAAHSTTKTHAEKRADRVEEQINDLHEQLHITDAQSQQWNAYAEVMRDNARRASEAFQQRAQKMQTMNADEVMKSYAQLAQMHAQDMQKLSSAWSDLYAALSPEQRQTADALFQNKAMSPHHGMHKKTAKPAGASSSAGT